MYNNNISYKILHFGFIAPFDIFSSFKN